MDSNFKMVKKSLAELTQEEIENLKTTCNKGGAFGAILKALELGRIEQAEKLSISILFSDDIITGWIFTDPAKQYNELAADDETSVMIYVSPAFRGKKVASKLMFESSESLKGKKLLAYPNKKTRPFFYKMGKAFGLSFTIKEPVLFYKR